VDGAADSSAACCPSVAAFPLLGGRRGFGAAGADGAGGLGGSGTGGAGTAGVGAGAVTSAPAALAGVRSALPLGRAAALPVLTAVGPAACTGDGAGSGAGAGAGVGDVDSTSAATEATGRSLDMPAKILRSTGTTSLGFAGSEGTNS
jgi:hypothetical protein